MSERRLHDGPIVVASVGRFIQLPSFSCAIRYIPI